MDALQALRERRSVRAFEERPIDKEALEAMVDCGRLAATARNEQPWEFVVVTDRDTLTRLGHATDHGRFIAEAAACIVVLCVDSKYYLEDGSAATQNILVAAHALGVGSCWVAGDKKPYTDDIQTIVSAPAGYRMVSMIALGYPAKIPTPKKRSLEEVIHWERF